MESDRLTEAELAALVSLEKAATPGEWHVGGKSNIVDADDAQVGYVPRGDGAGAASRRDANVRLIVSARNALPSLLAEVRALRAEVAALRECVGEAEEVLAPFMLMCSAWDGQPAETVVAEVGVQSIRVSAFREARDFWLGRLQCELDRAALAAERAGENG